MVDFRVVDAIISDFLIFLGDQNGKPFLRLSLHHQLPETLQVADVIQILSANGAAVNHLHDLQRVFGNLAVPSTNFSDGFL